MKKTSPPPEQLPVTPRYAKSASLYEEARLVMPGGVSSNYRMGQIPFPLAWERGQGAYLWDVDGNRYIDFALGNGAVFLGHAHPAVNAAVSESLSKGQLYAGQTEAELRLCEDIHGMVPCAEMVRLSMSGSDAVQTALRLARVATGRPKIVKFEGHYHGWFDNIAVSVMPHGGGLETPDVPYPYSKGLPSGTLTDIVVLPWNNAEALKACLDSMGSQIAGVILEPVPFNTLLAVPKPGFLEKVRELCTKAGVVLIFDEVVTGFRLSAGGAQAYFGVTPDLATFGKALGNGVPISAIAGKRDIMQLIATSGMMHAGTHNGNPISVSAARACLAELRRDGATIYPRMAELANQLAEGIRKLAREAGLPLQVQNVGPMLQTLLAEGGPLTDLRDGVGRADLERSYLFGAKLQDRGLRLLTVNWLLCAAHTRADIDQALEAVRETLQEMRTR